MICIYRYREKGEIWRTRKYDPSELSGPISSPPTGAGGTGGSSGISPSVGIASIADAVADAIHDTISLIDVAAVSSILLMLYKYGQWSIVHSLLIDYGIVLDSGTEEDSVGKYTMLHP